MRFDSLNSSIELQYSFHIFNNHSENVHIFGNQLDYVSCPSSGAHAPTLSSG